MAIDPEWRAKLAEKVNGFPSLVKNARATYTRLRPWITRYRGGMPAGVLATIAQLESGGSMDSAGDASLGEVGYFQITSSFPSSIGVDPAKRYDPETNVFLGGVEYQIEAVRMANAWPAVTLGTLDSWKLARLAFAIGGPGTKKLLAAARPAFAGQAFAGVKAWADATGAMALGSQSAGKVWYRIHLTELIFQAGMFVAPAFFSDPTRVPAPAGISYRFPNDVANYFHASPLRAMVALAAGTALIVI